MLRLRKFTFDDRIASVVEVANWFRDTDSALTLYYSGANPNFGQRFALYSPNEVKKEQATRQDETDVFAALGALSAIEAALREDFIIRCIKRRSDPLSQHFVSLYQIKGPKISLEEDILEGWKSHSTIQAHIIGQIKGAFKYRHWIAHGRYWQPNLGQNYDFFSIFQITNMVVSNFPLLKR